MTDPGWHHAPADGAVLVECWCQSERRRILTTDLRAGRTWACDRPDCVPPWGVRSAVPVPIRTRAKVDA